MSKYVEKRTERPHGRRQADSLAVRERDIFSAILDVAGALIAVLTAEGRIVLWNRACEKSTGFRATEAVGHYLWEVVNLPEEAEKVKAFYARLISSPFPETHERHWTRRDGSKMLISWSNTALYDAQGKVEYLIGTGFDITESRAVQLELQRRSHELAERVKELNCLYDISRLSELPDLSLATFCAKVLELIPAAWQYPHLATARIQIGSEEYTSADYETSVVCQSSQIAVDGLHVGLVEVCYRELTSEMGEQPFLPEEQSLLDNIAERIGQAVHHYDVTERIAEYQATLRSLASELALTGERERRRIAQELHDQVGHNLASIKYKLGALKKSGKLPELDDVLGLLEQTIQVSRNLTFELSPPVLHELGLGAALEWLVHQLRANFGIAGEFIDDRQPKPLTEDLRVELFQAARELLVNVGKHSKASTAQVRAEVTGDRLRIEVSDDGVGFDPAIRRSARGSTAGWGLFSIRERLAHLGAEMTIDSSPGYGTRITLSAPLAEPDVQAAPSADAAANGHEVPAGEPVTILLADDQALSRAGLRSLLEQQPGFQVVAEAADGLQAVQLAEQHQPDVVVMDIAMPRLNGIEATRRILAKRPETRVIALSMHADGQYVVEMLRAGASGYLLKDCAEEDLAQAIRVVQANLTFLSPGLADSVAADYVAGQTPSRPAAENQPNLTPRELEVLKLLAQGLPAKAVAQQLTVSLKTIETHRQHIMEKLEIHNIAGLTKYAIRAGLVELGE